MTDKQADENVRDGGRRETVILSGEIAPGWRLNGLWTVNVRGSHDNTLFVVTDKWLSLIGFADRLGGAVQSYIASLIEFYEVWEKSPPEVKYAKRKFPAIENLLRRIP